MHINRVQFPRFQYEEGRYIRDRALPRPWLTPGMVAAVQSPQTISEQKSLDMKRKNNWWGVYHVAQLCVTRGMRFETPPKFAQKVIAPDHKELFVSRLFQHEYLWDDQAISGRKWEVVLERLRTDSPEFEEVMAIKGSNSRSGNKLQRVVLSQDGSWRSPEILHKSEIDYCQPVEFYLDVVGRLALQGTPSSQILA